MKRLGQLGAPDVQVHGPRLGPRACLLRGRAGWSLETWSCSGHAFPALCGGEKQTTEGPVSTQATCFQATSTRAVELFLGFTSALSPAVPRKGRPSGWHGMAWEQQVWRGGWWVLAPRFLGAGLLRSPGRKAAGRFQEASPLCWALASPGSSRCWREVTSRSPRLSGILLPSP